MRDSNPWVIVLAAGEGSRLSSLTTGDDGSVVPKQFCSLRGGGSLLANTITRARSLARPERILVVVVEQQRKYWEPELAGLPAENVIVQPCNRGTSAGVLLPLMTILCRETQASVAVLPSDHYVEREDVLAAALHRAVDELAGEPGNITLLGIEPDRPETDYGWIVPVTGSSDLRRVEAFVEKPDLPLALRLLELDALWNSFIFVARGLVLAALFDSFLPDLFERVEAAFEGPQSHRDAEIEAIYATTATSDFSRDLLQPSTAYLRTLHVPPCGWTDLGTPERVARCLRELRTPRVASRLYSPLDLERRMTNRAS